MASKASRLEQVLMGLICLITCLIAIDTLRGVPARAVAFEQWAQRCTGSSSQIQLQPTFEFRTREVL